MAFQQAGTLHKVFNTEQKSERFRTREFVIEITDGKFAQMIKFQLTQDKCEAIDDHNEGDEIIVHFDLRGREWNERYFTNLNAWRIESASTAQPAPAGTSAEEFESQAKHMDNRATDLEFPDEPPF